MSTDAKEQSQMGKSNGQPPRPAKDRPIRDRDLSLRPTGVSVAPEAPVGVDSSTPPKTPTWAPLAGVAFSAVAIALLVLFYFKPPDPAQRPVFIVIVSFLAALSFGFVGGNIAVKFSIPLLRDHPASVSAAGGIGAFFGAALLCSWLMPAVVNPAERTDTWPPPSFLLKLAPTARDQAPGTVDFRSGEHSEYVARQPAPPMYLIKDVVLPKPGVPFEAAFRPVIEDSHVVDDRHQPDETAQLATSVCVIPIHSRGAPPKDLFALLSCVLGSQCSVQKDDPGWVRDCGKTASIMDWLVPSAHAATAASPPQYWLGTSLKTLKRRHDDPNDNPPFMELSISAQLIALGSSLSRAKYFTEELRVNDTPVYTDGWRPQELVVVGELAKGVTRSFGIQNLGFAGAFGGFEKVSVQFTWLDESKRELGASRLERRIVAFRDAEKMVQADGGVQFESHGEYQPSLRLDRFSIMAGSPGTLDEAERYRGKIDSSAQTIQGADGSKDEIVGVVRPPLIAWRLQPYNNPHFSLLLGIRRATGQISFSFDGGEAAQLCRFAYQNRGAFGGAIHETVLRYEWPPPGEKPDPSRNAYNLCKEL
jgi:hypothetical protein